MKDIKGTQLFRDFEAYAQTVKERLFRNNEEKALDRKSGRLAIIERLAKLELTRNDWMELKALIREMDSWTITSEGIWGLGNLSEMIRAMQPNLAFYRVAEKRDAVFAENLINLMKENLAASSALVAGGFHTEGLTHRLKAQGISYLLLMPKVTTLPDENHYRDHMKGEVAWSDYFEVEDNKVSIYKAFVRATRDRLLKETKEKPGRFLKSWRDQIIRDLSAQGRITKVGDYTQFLDELAQEDLKKDWRSQWLENVQRFLNRLRGLEETNQLTEKNIMNILQPSSTAAVVINGVASPGDRVSITALPVGGLRVEAEAPSADFEAIVSAIQAEAEEEARPAEGQERPEARIDLVDEAEFLGDVLNELVTRIRDLAGFDELGTLVPEFVDEVLLSNAVTEEDLQAGQKLEDLLGEFKILQGIVGDAARKQDQQRKVEGMAEHVIPIIQDRLAADREVEAAVMSPEAARAFSAPPSTGCWTATKSPWTACLTTRRRSSRPPPQARTAGSTWS